MSTLGVSIAGRRIAADQPPYVIAELSANHNGSLETALRIVEEAAMAGADAVKLQTYRPDTITLDCDEPDFVINPHFERDVRKLILGGVIDSNEHAGVPVILICRSGNRSTEAGNLLIEHGFHRVYNIEHGFEGELDDEHHRSTIGGWRFDGLPWDQC